MADSTKTPARVKPAKPYEGFPLFAHATGRWAKKVRGEMKYFGKWEDPDGALKLWLEQRDDLKAGRIPKTGHGLYTVRDAVNAFLDSKLAAVEKKELTERTYQDYKATGARLLECFGRTPPAASLTQKDFKRYAESIAAWAPVTRANEVQRVRTLFKYAYEAGLIEKPVLFGPDFKKPKAKTIRADKAAKPVRLFTPAEILDLHGRAGVQMKAMILLGVNCALGNSDISSLNWSHLDLTHGVLDYPRPKTGVERRAMLWPETVEALEAVKRYGAELLAVGENKGKPRHRPADPADAAAVFLTLQQVRFVRHDNSIRDSVAMAFGKLLDAAGIDRAGVNFYSLRHSFKTAAKGARDREATDRIMGHKDPSIGADYEHWRKDAEEDARLKAVADHVHGWLYGKPPAVKGKGKGKVKA